MERLVYIYIFEYGSVCKGAPLMRTLSQIPHPVVAITNDQNSDVARLSNVPAENYGLNLPLEMRLWTSDRTKNALPCESSAVTQ